jgi:hypothetical protein
MGQAIVYCSNCSAQLRGSDFDARKAFKVDDLNFCAKCYQEVVGSPPPPPPPPASTKNKIPVPSKNSHSTSRIAIALPPQPAPGEGGSGMMYGALGAIGVAIVLVMVFMTSGGRERPAAPPPAPPPAPPIVIPTPAPSVSPKEAAAQKALAKALRTENLEERRRLLVEAVAQADGTTLLNDAQRELNRAEEKLAQARAAAAANRSPAPVLVVPPPPTPPPPVSEPPPAPDRSREEAAAIAKWEAALAPATGRDYAAAIAALEKLGSASADVAILKSVSALHQDATATLARTTKGQKVSVEHRDASGGSRRVEASFAEVENGHVELRSDSTTIEVEIGEILPSSLAELHKSRGGAVDPATAAVYCLLEGDEAGAKRLAGAATVPDRYWNFGRKPPSADAARALYSEALALAAGYVTAADAGPKYQALLRDFPESPFVRRNKASIAARSQQCAREFLFTSADLKGAGTFKALKSAKGFTGWTSEADSDPAKMKDNFVELSYSVLPDATYRCWVYAGGCCQETFEFYAQGTEMKAGKEKESVEPGSGSASTIKPYLSSLKKTHSGHTGPKQPAHWEWVSIPLPKYSKAGLQQVRVLTAQKGFSVAFACVTSTRTAPPRETELKELERTRGSVPVAAPSGPRAIVLYQTAMDGTDAHLQGEYRDRALFAVPLFGMAFAGFEGGAGFTVPAQGEVRATYFLKTVTPFFVRIRVRRGEGKSDAYDAVVSDPVAGRPTEVRLPFTAFKPMAGLPFPPLAAGDVAPMMYFVGQDPNCGLRLDGFSVVEFRAEPAASATKALYAENFDAGPGRWGEGEMADGGTRGTKAYVMPSKGISCWGAFSVPVKETTTISFKVKPLQDVPQIQVLVWSDKLNDNGRLVINGLKKGEWNEIKFKANQLRIGASGDGVPIDLVANIKVFQGNSAPDAKALFDDFEIRD